MEEKEQECMTMVSFDFFVDEKRADKADILALRKEYKDLSLDEIKEKFRLKVNYWDGEYTLNGERKKNMPFFSEGQAGEFVRLETTIKPPPRITFQRALPRRLKISDLRWKTIFDISMVFSHPPVDIVPMLDRLSTTFKCKKEDEGDRIWLTKGPFTLYSNYADLKISLECGELIARNIFGPDAKEGGFGAQEDE